jgi:hypothetical protein
MLNKADSSELEEKALASSIIACMNYITSDLISWHRG